MTFEERYDSIVVEIDKRRSKWRLASVAWEDARQMVLITVAAQYHVYDPARGEFVKWVNKLITNRLINILRDNHLAWSRPCVTGCPWNRGGDSCEKTSNGIQGVECKAYRDWERRKLDHFRVQQTLPLENHVQEVNSIQSDFLNIGEAKTLIDAKIKLKLTNHEYKIYKLLFIQGKSEADVGKLLGYRKKPRAKMPAGYQAILKVKKIILSKAREVIAENDLA